MGHKSELISEFAIDLCDAQSFDDCFAVLERTIQKMGFDGLLYTSIPIDLPYLANNPPVFKVSDTYSPSFLDHYADAGFSAHDFTIDRITKGRKETLDWWHEERKGELSAAERSVIVVAREDYGIRHGLTIPTLSLASEISGVSVISTDTDSCFEVLSKQMRPTLECISKLFHARVHSDLECKTVFVAPLIASLTERERQVVRFIATGLPLKAIEEHYSISPGYAKNIVVTLCKKLGVENANQLRYLIGLYRLLDML